MLILNQMNYQSHNRDQPICRWDLPKHAVNGHDVTAITPKLCISATHK